MYMPVCYCTTRLGLRNEAHACIWKFGKVAKLCSKTSPNYRSPGAGISKAISRIGRGKARRRAHTIRHRAALASAARVGRPLRRRPIHWLAGAGEGGGMQFLARVRSRLRMGINHLLGLGLNWAARRSWHSRPGLAVMDQRQCSWGLRPAWLVFQPSPNRDREPIQKKKNHLTCLYIFSLLSTPFIPQVNTFLWLLRLMFDHLSYLNFLYK